MDPDKSKVKKRQTRGILWIALFLGILMPFGLYAALVNGQEALAILCFALLAAGFAITALRG